MNKNKLKSAFQFLSLLLCLALIPAAFAQPDKLTENVTYEEEICESSKIPELVTDSGNYTVYSINPTYYSVYVMPGNSETFNVSFKNEGNETLNVAPKVMSVPGSFYPLDKSWIKISSANVTVGPGIEQNFAVEVNVPEGADSGEYQAQIVFTDDVYPEEYGTPQYVNVMNLGISVPVLPKLEFQTSYIFDTIEPGKEYVYEIKIKNVAGKDVTIDPKVTRNNIYANPYTKPAFSGDLVEISAPSTIKAGEITNMTIRIPVPENASGTYEGFIEMNADGKGNDGSVPQLGLSLSISKPLSVPYVKTFNTKTADPITIKVSTDIYDPNSPVRISPKKEEPAFEMNLKCNSNPVNLTLVETTQGGSVYTQGLNFPIWSMENDSIYDGSSKQYAETYEVSGAIGTWELSILPKNTNGFTYSVSFGDSEK
ncbi:MAG: hypothetical protein ACM3RX_07645 [Methanococcaceae archaeon]